ncbi:hypothetical protein PG990_008600 [Apiospora arundinis]|uniref:Uncharacterized protein n=1 Tax=Apiospora arundinis TaxID=335852 RepID=A0ABR2JNT5_9PEZI
MTDQSALADRAPTFFFSIAELYLPLQLVSISIRPPQAIAIGPDCSCQQKLKLIVNRYLETLSSRNINAYSWTGPLATHHLHQKTNQRNDKSSKSSEQQQLAQLRKNRSTISRGQCMRQRV